MGIDPIHPLLVVLSAPSGAGKTTLCQRVLEADRRFTRVITCTTRPPRPGEREGVDYHFLASAAFARRRAAGEFLESARVHGYRYGTLLSAVIDPLRAGRDVLLNVDVQGAAAIRTAATRSPELRRSLVTVFLTPPSSQVLESRLRRRNTDSATVIRRRLRAARGELARWREFEYLLISTTPEEDVRRLRAIVDAERMRSTRSPAPEIGSQQEPPRGMPVAEGAARRRQRAGR